MSMLNGMEQRVGINDREINQTAMELAASNSLVLTFHLHFPPVDSASAGEQSRKQDKDVDFLREEINFAATFGIIDVRCRHV